MELTLKVFMTTGTHFSLPVIICRNSITIPFIKHRGTSHWIHFGAGNIFRAFQANVAQNLLNSGVLDTGLIAAEGYDYEIIEKLPSPRQFKHSRHLKGRQHRGKDHRRQHHGVSDPGQ